MKNLKFLMISLILLSLGVVWLLLAPRDFLSDNWIKAVWSDYSYICGLAGIIAGAGLKALAIRHPEVPSDKILDYLGKVVLKK